MNFLQQLLEGDALEDEIDDHIDEWHEQKTDISLHDYLGFTWNEYSLWVENPQTLGKILYCRKTNRSIDDSDWEGVHLLAARSQTQQDPAILKNWLKSNGLM